MIGIVRTFAVVKDRLYAVQWSGDEKDCFRTIFENWQDPEFLEEFFESNKSDLDSEFWKHISVEEATDRTLDEALRFEKQFIKISNESISNPGKTLHDELFNQLSKFDSSFIRVKSKAYGGRRSWLRVYAIRLGMNCFLITGGAIKLTDTMNDRVHTTEELKRLNYCSQFLKDEGIETESDFKEYIEREEHGK